MQYRYRPRDFLKQPDFFGRRVDAEWKPDSEEEKARVAAAYYQHLAACETLRIASEKDWSLSDLAARVGEKPDTLRWKLYGEGPATLDDITSWALAVEAVNVLPAPPDLKPDAPTGLSGCAEGPPLVERRARRSLAAMRQATVASN